MYVGFLLDRDLALCQETIIIQNLGRLAAKCELQAKDAPAYAGIFLSNMATRYREAQHAELIGR